METIGEIIKTARQSKLLTQQRLGELLGYTGRNAERMVQQWEHGKRPVPQNKIKLLSVVLCIPLERLLP